MPGVIGSIATWYAGLSTAAAFVVNVAISATLSVISSKLFGPKFDPIREELSAKQVTTRNSLEYKKIVYGRAMLSGPIVYENLSGNDNEYLWYRIALTGHQCADLISLWIDGDEIPAADIAWTPGAGASDGTGTGDVSTTRFVGSGSTKAVSIWYYLGDPDQPVPGALNSAFGEIGTNHRCRGDANFVVRMLYNEQTEQVWEAGVPRNFKAVMDGRLIYDSRLDSTNGGSGSHRYTDDSTWDWSDNGPMCVADYLVNYMGADPATSIDWPSFAAAADDCDPSVDIPTSSSETRFTTNGVLSEGESHEDNLNALLSSFDGRLTYKGGVWSLRASVWESPSVSLTESDFLSDLDVRGSAPKSERFNVVRGHFVDPARLYEPVEFEAVTDASYVTRDGGREIENDLTLPCTNSNYMAQRIAFRLLAQSDNQIIVRGTVREIGAELAPQTVVAFTSPTYGWDAKAFRVFRWEPVGPGMYDIEMREDFESSYDDPAEGDYTVAGGAEITIPSDRVPAPSNLAATGVPGGIHLTWTTPALGSLRVTQVYESPDNDWANANLIAETNSDSLTVTHEAGTTRWYWVRSKRNSGLVSNRDPNSDTSTVTATAGAIEIETPVVNDAADGNSAYTSGTQPRIENPALDEDASYQSPANIDTRCLVQWTAQARISTTTSGTAVGESRLEVTVRVDGTPVHQKYLVLEGYTVSTNLWGQIAGSISVAVPAGEEVEVSVDTYRHFSGSGSSPAQTHYWQNVLLTITPQREDVT